ncbi:hypothetical protein AB4Z46_02190 [Variovorax sp. M-6]|uniref:hypothetical protein n=1 Tax=Variovorax sp. M-6 TaxID=3233041 RepID=UPI003F9B33F2
MKAFLRLATILCVTCAMLMACASRGPEELEAAPFRLSAGDKVGVFVGISPQPKQFHQGMTAGGNFVKTYPFNWGLEEGVRSAINEALKSQGLVPVDLNAARLNAGYMSPEELPAMREKSGVHAIIVVKSVRAYIGLPVHLHADAPGVYSVRSIFGTGFTTVAPLQWNVWALDGSGEDVALRPELSTQLNTLVQVRPELWKGVAVADYEAISAAEFEPVKAIILRSVSQTAEDVARTLIAQ